jgi:hypothetical protein
MPGHGLTPPPQLRRQLFEELSTTNNPIIHSNTNHFVELRTRSTERSSTLHQLRLHTVLLTFHARPRTREARVETSLSSCCALLRPAAHHFSTYVVYRRVLQISLFTHTQARSSPHPYIHQNACLDGSDHCSLPRREQQHSSIRSHAFLYLPIQYASPLLF